MGLARYDQEQGCNLWRCSVCGHVGPWGNSWIAYGSERLFDELAPELFPTFCSGECQQAAVRQGIDSYVPKGF